MPPETPVFPVSRPLVLASASSIRAQLLTGAGIPVEVEASGLDEAAALSAMRGDGPPPPPADVAHLLAQAKAAMVSARRPTDLVIAADQTLEFEGELFVKASSIEEARRNLLRMRGRRHALHAAVAIASGGEAIWSHVETAWLTMRDFSPKFVGMYSVAAGDDMLASVGGYRLEGEGLQLFERLEGDWFAMLGLPLLPLLDALRRNGVLES